MSDERLTQRLAAWQAAGLIDAATAGRLTAFEAAAEGEPAELPLAPAISPWFGAQLSISEMLGYLGAAFLLAAWHAFLNVSWSDFGLEALEFAVPAVVLALIGAGMGGESDRRSRAAGVSLIAATLYVGLAARAVIDALNPVMAPDVVLVLSCLVAVVAAVAFRRLHPAVLTQFGLALAIVTQASVTLAWLNNVAYPVANQFDSNGAPALDATAAVVRVILAAGWWLAWALGIGLLGMYEARIALRQPASASGDAAARRSALSRCIAGLVAVLGVTLAVMQSNSYGRVLAAWLGDVAILTVVTVLVIVAFRRMSSAFLYPAALGLIVALTDVNATYVAERSGVAGALLLEGVILVAGGLAAERLRRRLTRDLIQRGSHHGVPG